MTKDLIAMSDFDRRSARPAVGAADMSVDTGLRAFMLGVYNKLALGLVLSGALAYIFSSTPAAALFYQLSGERLVGLTGLGYAMRFAPLVILLGASFFMRNPSPRSAAMLYWSIVSLLGASLSIWFVMYNLGSVAEVFFITAAAFGALSLFGYVTKRDLSGMGSFLMMGLFGLIIASIVNMFMHNSMIHFVITILGLLIFAGLTAYDTQRLKMTYYDLGGDQAAMGVATSYGALSLYLDFINLFQFLMSILGSRR
jgi:FtsH-binding integral membrane protein